MSLCFTTVAVTFVFSAPPPAAQPNAPPQPLTVNLNQLYQDGMNAFLMEESRASGYKSNNSKWL